MKRQLIQQNYIFKTEVKNIVIIGSIIWKHALLRKNQTNGNINRLNTKDIGLESKQNIYELSWTSKNSNNNVEIPRITWLLFISKWIFIINKLKWVRALWTPNGSLLRTAAWSILQIDQTKTNLQN